MTELLKNAWLGWRDFTSTGKLAALLLVSLLFLWIYYKKICGKNFLVYTSLAAGMCMLPVMAMLLMLYQTKFYDYEWIWSIVPVTAMIAFAGTVFIAEYLEELAEGDKKKKLAAIVLLLGVLVLCSGLGERSWDSEKEAAERNAAQELLRELKERMGQQQICLWAPGEVLEYAREVDGEVQLLYGRNIWDASLNAYAYDAYSQELLELMYWMEDEEEAMSAEECAGFLQNTEANCVLLSGDETGETIQCFEEVLQTEAERFGDYYLLIR